VSTGARAELDELLEALRARLARGGPRVRAHELDAMHDLLEVAQREDEAMPPPAPPRYESSGGVSIWRGAEPPRPPLPSWRALEAEFASDEAEPVEPELVEPASAEPEPVEPTTDGGARPAKALPRAERRRLQRWIARNVDTGGEPSLREIEREFRIPWRQVRDLHEREVAKRNH
jgi:hypothetical protein